MNRNGSHALRRWGFAPILALGAGLATGVSQALPARGLPADRSVRSTSGQFLVVGPAPQASNSLTNRQSERTPLLRLDAYQLSVISERVKSAMLRELALPDRWRGRIRLNVQSYARPDQTIGVESTRAMDGWHYHVAVPEHVQPQRLVRGLVQVLVLEMANRHAGWQLAEPPLWLAEGMAARIWQSHRASLTLSPHTLTATTFRQTDPLAPTRVFLLTNAPINFAQLSLAPPELLTVERLVLYQHCSHLLLGELQRLPGGRDLLAAFVFGLPQHLNWQTSFLRTYAGHFPNLLAVEKWWALAVASFTGRDPSQIWSFDRAWKQVEDVLLTPALVSQDPESLPERTLLPIQQVLLRWDGITARQILRQKAAQLTGLQRNVPTEMILLVERYRAALETYLARLGQPLGMGSLRHDPRGNVRLITEDFIRQLNSLDAERQVLKARWPPAASAQTAAQ